YDSGQTKRIEACFQSVSSVLIRSHFEVRPEGLEPPTTWFEARYSVQLSYGRIKHRNRVLSKNSVSNRGEWWDLNPRSSGPQPDVLTPTPHPPRGTLRTCAIRILPHQGGVGKVE